MTNDDQKAALTMGMTKRYLEDWEARGWSPAADKYVCPDCLLDHVLAQAVRDAAQADTCDYCRQSTPDQSLAAPVDVVLELVVPGLHSENEDPIEQVAWEGGFTIDPTDTRDLLQEYEVTENGDLIDDIAEAIATTHWVDKDPYAAAPHEALLWGWRGFREHVKHRSRYMFLDPTDATAPGGNGEIAIDQMPAALRAAIDAGGLARLLQAGTTYHRARPGPYDPANPPSTAGELGSPPDANARNNRMTPAGISAFYGASTREGALAEVRAYSDSPQLSIGAFVTARDMLVIDLVDLPAVPSAFDEPRRHVRPAILFLREFATDVAVPAQPDDREHLEYVPTQVVAEYLKHRYEHPDGPVMGVLWRSSLNPDVIDCVLFVDNDGCTSVGPGWEANPKHWLALVPGSVEHLHQYFGGDRAGG